MCLVPQADASHLRALAGDPQVSSIVTEASAKEVGDVCAVLLRGLSPAERREALRYASANSSGPKLDVVPIVALMPEGSSIEQLSAVWNGLMLMLLALGSSSADTSVGTVVANAASMASGVPFASDPLVAERQNEVVLAKSILEAALLVDEEAQKWFKDNHLTDALEYAAAAARRGATDAVKDAGVADELARQIYDCMVHDYPLGGSPLTGGGLADFAADIWGGIRDAAGKAIQDWGSSILSSDKSENSLGNVVSKVAEAARSKAAAGADQATSLVGDEEGTIANAVARGVTDARKALEDARERLESGQANIASYQAQLRDASIQNAKLQWAQAFLMRQMT